VFSRAAFAWEGSTTTSVAVIPPSIDAFSPKNQRSASPTSRRSSAPPARGRDHVPAARVRAARRQHAHVDASGAVIEEQPLRLDTPLVAQVSRWDRLKDPLGVLEAFAEHVAPDATRTSCSRARRRGRRRRPEGAEVLAEVEDAWRELPTEVARRVHLALLPMDDADENASSSTRSSARRRRGAEEPRRGLRADRRPRRCGRRARSSPPSRRHPGPDRGRRVTGSWSSPHDLDAFGQRVAGLLERPADAERIGGAAQARVRDHFLGPRHLEQWADLLERVL
jgi:trehalose synthase